MISSLTNNEVNYIKNTVKYKIIPKGTVLYRTQSIKHNPILKPLYDNDTGKIGMYLSNTIHIPLGMILELNKPLNLFKYITTKDIKLYLGKYTFRNLEPKLYYKSFNDWKKCNFQININPKEMKYWNHFDYAYPIHDIFKNKKWKKKDVYEIFITNKNDIKFLNESILIKLKENNMNYINQNPIDMNTAKKLLQNEIN